MPDGVKAIVRWRGNSKLVHFEDTRLAAAVERFQAEDPIRIVFDNLDAPPGTYEVASKTTPGGCWEIRLDPRTGQHIGNHNCPYRAERPRQNYPCIHIAAAWVVWRANRDADDPFIQRLTAYQEQENAMAEPTTAVDVYRGSQELTPYYVPSRDEIGQTLSLAKVLFETRGASIPSGIKNVQEAAAIIMAGRELGLDPMASFRRMYVVNGQTQPDAQTMAGLMQKGGADLIYHEATDTAADVELVRPGRPSVRIRYTIEQATKAGLVKSNMKTVWEYGKKTDKKKETSPWILFPADMLVWKAVTRLGRRGAADLINSMQSAMVRVDDFSDAMKQLSPEDVHDGVWNELNTAERPALSDGGAGDDEDEDVQDAESGEAAETPAAPSEPAAPAESSEHPERHLNYVIAHSDTAANHEVLSAFQKACRGMGSLPDDKEAMTLDEIVQSVGGKWPTK